MIEVRTCDTVINDFTYKALDIIKALQIPIGTNVTVFNDEDYIDIFKKKMPSETLGCCVTKNLSDKISIYIRSNLSEKNTFETILHEFIHTCKGCFNHGLQFERYADKINKYIFKHYPNYKNFSCGIGDQIIDESSYIKNTYKYVIVCPHCKAKSYFTKNCKTVKDISMAFKLKISSNYKCQKCGCSKLIPKEITCA